MKFQLKAMEKKWILYDIANSAFALLISTIIPIYFNYLAGDAGLSEVNYLAYWGYATSAATVIVAVLGPFLGTVSDAAGQKKKIFLATLLLGAFGCVFLGFMQSWLWFLVLFVLAKSAYSLSLVIYDSMLTDITTEERMDEGLCPGICLGIYWKLHSFCGKFDVGVVLRKIRNHHADGNGHLIYPGGDLVGVAYDTSFEIIPSDTQQKTGRLGTVWCETSGTDCF